MTDTRANLMILNNRCEFWFNGANVAAPVAVCPVARLADTLDAVGADSVAVEFHTTAKAEDVAADLRKYGKRLSGIVGKWAASAWAPKVEGGVVYTCTLNRR